MSVLVSILVSIILLQFYEGLVQWRAHNENCMNTDSVLGTVLGTDARLLNGHNDYYLLLSEGIIQQIEVLTEKQENSYLFFNLKNVLLAPLKT